MISQCYASGIRETRTIRISDLDDPSLDVYARMNENQLRRLYEPAPGLFIAESPKVIERALDAGYEPVSFLVCEELLTACLTKESGTLCYGSDMPEKQKASLLLDRCPGVNVYTAPMPVMEKLTGFHLTLGMLCAMRRKKLPSPEEICGKARRVAVLEEVVNPANIGAVIRSAAALGIDSLLLTKGCADPLYRRSCRVSMGNVFLIPWSIMDGPDLEWPAKGLKFLKERGFKAAALALEENSIPVDSPILYSEEKLALILGSEGQGLLDETIGMCDYTVTVPMARGADSLNVAAAAAIAFWQLCWNQ